MESLQKLQTRFTVKEGLYLLENSSRSALIQELKELYPSSPRGSIRTVASGRSFLIGYLYTLHSTFHKLGLASTQTIPFLSDISDGSCCEAFAF